MELQKAKVNGFAVVRNSGGYIKADNYENLPDEYKAILKELVEEDFGITAESFPNVDERFRR